MLRSRIGFSLVLICLVSLLTACGGGGDDEVESTMTPPPSPVDPPPLTQTCPDGSTIPVDQACPTPPSEDSDSAALDRAANAVPIFGSVSQGSNVRDGITTDSVSIAYIRHGNIFHPIVTIQTGDGVEMVSSDDPTRIDVVLRSGELIHVDPESDWQAAYDWEDHTEPNIVGPTLAVSDASLQHPREGRTIHRVYAEDILDDSIEGTAGSWTKMSALGLTDYPATIATGEDDHLSWGVWAYFTTTLSAVDSAASPDSALSDLAFGAFADGVETPASNIPVGGTASYSGYTSGWAVGGSEDFLFLGQVNLQADFGSSSVSGRVDNFQVYDLFQNENGGVDPVTPEPPVEVASTHDDFLQNLAINLGNASIASGTFTGDARATTGLDGAVGKWGGQFFGTPDNAGDAPPAAGGTWGVTQGTGDNDWKMIGGFGTWKP